MTSRVVGVAVALAVGALTALFGTAVHRAYPPWGLLLAFVATGAGAVFARAFAGLAGLFATGFAWLAGVLMAAYVPRGGDVLVVPGALGYSWMFAPLVLFAVAAFLPNRWFTDDSTQQ